jgi:hypothetical protein
MSFRGQQSFLESSMRSIRLNKEISFVGEALFGNRTLGTVARIGRDLQIDLFVNDFDVFAKREIPTSVVGEKQGWKITGHGAVRITYGQEQDFESLVKGLDLTEDQMGGMLVSGSRDLWWQMTVHPQAIDFMKTDLGADQIDEWGALFYPEDSHRGIRAFMNNTSHRCCRDLPTIFSGVDECIYFNNTQNWTTASILEEIPLIASVLSLFVGSPVTYSRLIGRQERDVRFIRANCISNPNSFICPGPFNGHARVRKSAEDVFRRDFPMLIDRIYTGPKCDTTLMVLSYFEELYTVIHEETRIAFSFQLMEALAHLKGITIKHFLKDKIKEDLRKTFSKKMCPKCYSLLSTALKPDTDDFDPYIEKALDVIGAKGSFSLNVADMKTIAKEYRNEVFHGGFFEKKMEGADGKLDILPADLRAELPALFQATASILAAHLLLGMDFADLEAAKTDKTIQPKSL